MEGIAGEQLPNEEDRSAATHPKHLAMLDRLSTRHATLTSTKAPSPSSSFLDLFSSSKHSVESLLQQQPPSNDDDDGRRSHISHISSSISDLESLLSRNAHLLSAYDLRASLDSIARLKLSLHSLSSTLLPRKSFSFRNRNRPRPDPQPLPPPPPPLPVAPLRSSPGLRGLHAATVVRDLRGPAFRNGEFVLEDLDSCEVYLRGAVRALFVHRVRNSKVFAGPATGSVLVEGVDSCTFVAAAHQIRIHHAKGTDFYLRVRSRPIIEDCEGVRFGPYRLEYGGLEEELEVAGLGEETGNWANVDDFRWLRAVQSPNWRVLEEDEREGVVDISDLEETG